MFKFIITVIFFSSVSHSDTLKEPCSIVNKCQVEKKSWVKNAWRIDYTKHLILNSLCSGDRTSLQLEPELGLELWVFSGNSTSNLPLKKKPYISGSLFSYKLTHIVATVDAPLESAAFSMSHRLKPRGNSIVEVSCYKE